MKTYTVTLGPIGGGLNIQVQVTTSGPLHTARKIAENQNPGYCSLSVIEIK